MKKIFSLLIAGSLAIVSCSKEDVTDEMESKTVETPTKEEEGIETPKKEEELTPLTVEEGKQKLEDNSIEILSIVDDFRNDTALLEVEEFLKYLDERQKEEEIVYIDDTYENDDDENYNDNVIYTKIKSSLQIATEVKKGKINAVKYPKTFLRNLTSENETDLEQDFNELVGTHTWNEKKNEFDFVEGNNNNIVFSVNQNNKTAVLTISNFSAYTHATGEEAPKSIAMNLKVGGTTIMSATYDATINTADYLPTKITAKMSLGGLSFDAAVDNDNRTGKITKSLKIDDSQIMSITMNHNGDLSEINATGDSTKEYNDILNSLNTTVTLGNATVEIVNKIPENVTDVDFEDLDKLINLLNTSTDVTLSVDDVKVANGEFYKNEYIEEDVYMSGYEDKYFVFESIDSNNRDNAITTFDNREAYSNSKYAKEAFSIFYKPTVIVEKVVSTNIAPYIYIDDKYPNRETDEGYYLSYDLLDEYFDSKTDIFLFDYNIYYESDEIVFLEEEVILDSNEDIYEYINNNYPQFHYTDKDGITHDVRFYEKDIYYATDYVFWYEDVEKEALDLQLVFSDGTKSTAEAYFGAGFEQVLDALENTENVYQ